MLIIFSMPAAAQIGGGSPNPDINLDCPGSNVEIEVGPGDARIGTVICTLENPSIHNENINISVGELDIEVSYPGSVSVGAGEETTFTISWSAEIYASVATYNADIEATVTSVNGVPYAFGNTKSDSVKIEIMPFGRPWIDMEGQELTLNYGETTTLNFSMKNTGNTQDTLSVTLENQSGLEEFGFTFDFSQTSASLEVNKSKEIILTITASKEILDGSFVVLLHVSSALADDSGDPWVVEDNFRLQSLAKEESFLTTSVDNVPAWAVTTAMVLVGLAGVGIVVVVVKLMMSSRGGGAASDDYDFDDDFDDDFDLDDEEFDDFALDDL
jgi:hypothetical protein